MIVNVRICVCVFIYHDPIYNSLSSQGDPKKKCFCAVKITFDNGGVW